ncbi:MAG: hypothetical protein PF904_16255 [Kiritimatiellae bacterium]|jgi:hypothetical protein|nr:hypothetical protein [Kiritimatiellia bacterium]
MYRYRLTLTTFLLLGLATVAFAATEKAPMPDAVWLTCMRNIPSHLVINWVTKNPQPSIVRFGTNDACEIKALLKGNRVLHHVEVPLPKNPPFYYRLEIDGVLTDAVLFQGIPEKDLRIAMVADWGFASVKVNSLLKDKPHMLVTGGDHISRLHGSGVKGESAKLNLQPHLKLLEKYPELFRTTLFMPVLGNHDREIRPRAPLANLKAPVYDVDASAYLSVFPLPGDGWKWYFEIPEFGVKLIGLDLNHLSDIGTLLQTGHDYRSNSIQLRWYAALMKDRPRWPFTLTLNNASCASVRNLCHGEWNRLIRQGTLCATGFGYFGEFSDDKGFPWFNTSLNGRGDLYKDPYSKFVAQEDNYLLFRFTRGNPQMHVDIKRLNDGKVLNTQTLNGRQPN